MSRLKIDPEFKALCPTLTDEERALLEESLVREGCLDPLKVWYKKDILLDGHNRFEICETKEIPYRIEPVRLPSRTEAIRWIAKNQLGRRNATEEQKSYLRGMLYLEEKKEHGGDRKSDQGASDALWSGDTAEKIAEEQGVSERTIHNDAAFAQAVNALTEKAGDEARQAALSGKMTKTEVKEAAEMSLAQLKQKLAEVKGRKKKRLRNKTARQRRWAAAQQGKNSDEGSDRQPGEEVLDEEGNELPAQAVKAFEARAAYLEVCRHFDDLVHEVEELKSSPAAAFAPIHSAVGHLKSGKNDLYQSRPALVCPYCKGSDNNCRACKGRG